VKRFYILIVVLLILSIISCASVKFKPEEIDPWLVTISGDMSATINVEGKWSDPESEGVMGWGEGTVIQNGNKLSGTIGSYDLKGVVSGGIVYLAFYTKGRVYYTARLQIIERGVLAGKYFDADDREQKKGYDTKFNVTYL